MITIWPLDNTDYTAEAIGAFSGTRTRGVFSADNNLACTPTGGRTVTISPGLAWLKKSDFWGVALLNTETLTFEIDVASGTLSRYIAVVARLDKDANKPEIILRYGSLLTNPVLPNIARDAHADELFLCAIFQRAGSVEITAADITDLRTDEQYCGIMRDGVTGIPTAQLQKQANDLIEQLKAAIKACLDGALPDGSVTTATFSPSAVAPNAVYATRAGNANNAANLNGQKPEYYLPNPNVLDNTNFQNPINQRGLLTYTSPKNDSIYMIDRWSVRNGTYEVAAKRLTLNPTASTYSNAGITQNIEWKKHFKIGDTMTLSAKINGAVYSLTGVFTNSGPGIIAKLAFSLDYEFFIYRSSNENLVSVGICNADTRQNKGVFDLEWIKLEKGDTATPYVPKNYSVELAECQRYFWKDYGGLIYLYYIGNYQYINNLFFPVTMRIAPTVTFQGIAGSLSLHQVWNAGVRIYGGVSSASDYQAILNNLQASADL